MKKIIFYLLLSIAVSIRLYSQTPADSIKKQQLNEVKIKSKTSGTEIKEMTPIRIEKMNSYELKKNACCNLAESFESSPTVEVSFSNAFTGSKQIQMLGLSGTYVQMMTDVMPTIRGLNYTYGFNNIPGTQVDAIYINKGPGSVTNGFESMTGQIDIELLKPEKTNSIFINAYLNNEERMELNLNLAKPIGQKWSALLSVHCSQMKMKMDANHDGYLDLPLNRQLNFIQRWKYNSFRRIESMFGVKGLVDEKTGGQMNFNPATDKLTNHFYGIGINTTHVELFNKTSYNVNEKTNQSIGFQFSTSMHNIDAYYGLQPYTGRQYSLFANLIYQTFIRNHNHVFKTGGGTLMDNVNEFYQTKTYKRGEAVSGVFGEYTFVGSEKYAVLLGARMDYHPDLKKVFFTPRGNLKYSITKTTSVRLSAGSGFRSAFIFAENPQLFVSNRQAVVLEKLLPEQSWNYGFNISQKLGHENRLSVDVFRTDFVNQVVADYDWNPQQVLFYNLRGKSFSTYIQTELYLELTEQLHVRFAHKFNDVQTNYLSGMKQKALNPIQRALGNVAYDSKDEHWKFDATLQWIGKQRLPDYSANPKAFREEKFSEPYFRLLGQITYIYKQFEFYGGSENINNFVQDDRIIDAAHPFGNYFDGGSIWGPVIGRMGYVGVRWTKK